MWRSEQPVILRANTQGFGAAAVEAALVGAAAVVAADAATGAVGIWPIAGTDAAAGALAAAGRSNTLPPLELRDALPRLPK